MFLVYSLLGFCLIGKLSAQHQIPVFNIKHYGAEGQKQQDAGQAIQQAIDACAAAGGGLVYFPPGAYTSATVALKSNVTLHLEAGVVWYASRDSSAYNLTKSSGFGEIGVPVLLYGKNLQNISITGKGTIDGQAEHTWEDLKGPDNFIALETENARRSGVKMKRAYAVAPRVSLVYLVDCRNIHIENITLQWSPHWTLHVAHSQQVFIRGIRLFTDLKKGVNADGIDIDGCKDVMITDCHIATGDDAICLKSTNRDGRFTNCENITVSNCTLTSTSAALKIGTETFGDFRNIVFSNCTISNTNRGIGIFVRDGGTVEGVLFSNLVMDCSRKDFFWWGDGDALRIVLLKRTPQSKLGTIRNIVVSNVVANVQGSSLIAGHTEKEIENIVLSVCSCKCIQKRLQISGRLMRCWQRVLDVSR
jgi:polygalacturonase